MILSFRPELLIGPLPLTQLRAQLPDRNGSALSVEGQARGVLHLLLDFAEDPTPSQSTANDWSLCPNCDVSVESLSSPYCSENCREQAAFVRQFRSGLTTGALLLPDKQIAFGQKLWWILGGGLPLRESLIPESAKRQVSRRSEGKCETCGELMATVENVGSGCNRPLHLRAVCQLCSKTKPFGDSTWTQSSRVVELLTDFGRRVSVTTSERQCDDPDAWDWREFMARRRLERT